MTESGVVRSDQSPVRRSDDYRVVYSNNSTIRITPGDIQITFSLMKNDPGSASIYMEEQISIVLSPQGAKITATAMQQMISAYESQFGEIRVLPGTIIPQGAYDQLVKGVVDSLKSKSP